MRALAAEKIPFLVVGGSAAVLQGAPFVTLDVDLWIGLPARSYMRVINLCKALEAQLHSPTAVILPGEHVVNFLYQVDGLSSFRSESKSARRALWHGVEVRLLPVERIIKSKEAIQRPKDLVHLPELRRLLAAERLVENQTKQSPPKARKK